MLKGKKFVDINIYYKKNPKTIIFLFFLPVFQSNET